MSETLRITCPCGYENWVPAEKLGQTVPCFVCGADLQVDEAAETGHRQSPDAAGSFEDTAAPESPFAPPARPARRDPATTFEEAEEKARRAPRSPLEADEFENAVRPKFQHAPPTPAPSPAGPRPRSPFEADAPDEDRLLRREENLVADPFSRKLVPAPAPAPSMVDEMEKHRPREKRTRHAYIETISPHDAPTGEKCTNCGRELRGSWDRIESSAGVICYVCSNLATHDIPDRVKGGSSDRREIRESDLLVGPDVPKVPVETDAWWADPKSPEFKRVLLVAASLILILTAYVAFFDKSDPGDRALPTAEEVENLPAYATAIMNVWGYASAFLSMFIATYIALSMTSSLPHETFRMNAVIVAAVAVPLAVITIILDFAAGIVPLWGPILVPLAKWALIAMLFTRWLRVRFSTLIFLLLIYKACRSLLFPAIGALLLKPFLG